MAYEAHKWKIGEEITSDKLNHIEKGIEAGGDIQTNIQNPTDGQTLKYDAESGKWVNGEGGSGKLIVNVNKTETSATLDKTWKEIYDAFPNVILKEVVDDFEYYRNVAYLDVGEYIFQVAVLSGTSDPLDYIYYDSASENDYPIYTWE